MNDQKYQSSQRLSRGPSEVEVVLWLKRYLVREGLQGRKAREILVDADSSYLRSSFCKELEPTGTVWIGSWRPDMICVVDDNRAEKIIGFEVKSYTDHEKGIVQANRYRDGVHESYLCVPLSDGKTPEWLRETALQIGVGLMRASPERVDIEIRPTRPRPDPKLLLATRRYLLGENSLRALGLNKPLHYAAVLMAYAYTEEPLEALRNIWGLQGSAIKHAIRGAKTLGLLSTDEQVTMKGNAYAKIFKALLFDLAKVRGLTKRRLVNCEPSYAAVLQPILLDHPAVDMIIRVLVRHGGGPMTVIQLAELAQIEDEGMARAVFGPPPLNGAVWQIRPSTRFNLKAALYDVGLIDSPLAKGAGGLQNQEGYDPRKDIWQAGQAVTSIESGS